MERDTEGPPALRTLSVPRVSDETPWNTAPMGPTETPKRHQNGADNNNQPRKRNVPHIAPDKGIKRHKNQNATPPGSVLNTNGRAHRVGDIIMGTTQSTAAPIDKPIVPSTGHKKTQGDIRKFFGKPNVNHPAALATADTDAIHTNTNSKREHAAINGAGDNGGGDEESSLSR